MSCQESKQVPKRSGIRSQKLRRVIPEVIAEVTRKVISEAAHKAIPEVSCLKKRFPNMTENESGSYQRPGLPSFDAVRGRLGS